MANIASNPWSFQSGDVVTAAITAVTGLTRTADGNVTLTTTVPLVAVQGTNITIIGATLAAYNGFYMVISNTANTTFVLDPQFAIPAATAQSGGGTAILCSYNAYVRIEDMSWQNAGAAGQLLDIRDRAGNIIWQATSTGAGQQNRGKVFWVNGLSLVSLPSGIVIVTVN